MTIDPKRIHMIAEICAGLAASARTAQERNLFTGEYVKWLRIALDREKAQFAELLRFEDDGGAVGVAERLHL